MLENNQSTCKAGRLSVGHPVDVASGTLFTVLHDFFYPGSIPLVWKRRYSTDSSTNSWLGRGWSSPFFMSLERIPEGYRLIDEDGGPLVFPTAAGTLGPGEKVMSLGANMELSREQHYFVVWHWHHGTDDVERFYFAANDWHPMPLEAIENIPGHQIRLEYDSQGRPTRIKQELEQRVIELVYNSASLIESIYFLSQTGVRKLLVSYNYDRDRHLREAANAGGTSGLYEYDSDHRLVRETNPLGSAFSFEYDKQGRCIYSSGEGRYLERKLQYFTAPRMTRVTDSLGNKTDYYVNDAGLVLQEVSPLRAVQTREYDEHGREVAYTDPLGAVRRYGYDEQGNRSLVVHEDGSETRMAYNSLHLLVEFTSPTGAKWIYERDRQGNILSLTNPLGHKNSFGRGAQNLVIQSITPAGRRVTREYGPALRWVEAADQISLISRLEFDEAGNQTAAFNAEGLVQRVRFDELERPVEVIDKRGGLYTLRWNAINELVERTGPDIGWERREYDRFGQIIKHSNPLGDMRLEYDSEGRMTVVVNRAGERMSLEYDADGRLTGQRTFDGRTERSEYNARGDVSRIPLADGREITFKYYPTGELAVRESSDGLKEAFVWDPDGNLVQAETSATKVELIRNAAGGVIAEIQNGRRIDYDLDPDGNRIGRRMAGIEGANLVCRNDVRGRLTALTDGAGVFQQLRWDNVDRLTQRALPGQVVEDFTYDSSGRIEQQLVHSFQGTVVQRRYQYDAMDNITNLEDLRRGRSEYEYDEIGRLTLARNTRQPTEFYRYDPNGTMIETHRGLRVLQPGGRTLSDGERSFEYDVNGCVSRIRSSKWDLELHYDVDGRISWARSSDGIHADYVYDALGRRVRKRVNGVETDYLWEGCVLAAEGKNKEFADQFYFYGLEPMAQWCQGKRFIPVTDQAGVVRELLNTEGAVAWEGTFESYGAMLTERGEPKNPFRFRGQYFDGETGLHFNFFRTYDPRLANYLSPDPIGIEGGANYFAYPRNPLLWDDPFGLKCGRASCKAEEKMDKHFNGKGYTKVSVKGKGVMANGIDAIYYNPKGDPKYIIAEAKSGGAVLRWSGPKDANGKGTIQQMSDGWINGKPGKSGETRLEAALPPVMDANGKPQPNPHLAAIQNGTEGPVGKQVYNPDKTPTVRKLGDYGGAGSPNNTI